MRTLITLILALMLMAATPTAEARPGDEPPEDPTDPSTGGNETQPQDPGNETGNETRPDDPGPDDGNETGPPDDFPGPGDFPVDPRDRFPDEGCEHAPKERPSEVPNWVPIPYERCDDDSEG